MFCLKPSNINYILRNAYLIRSISTYNMCVEHLNKRTLLKLSGPDTVPYLQSMITNDMKRVEDSSAIYSLLLNSRGRVLYDIILYKVNSAEYFVEYESTAVEYLHKHLLMYRLRKNVQIEPLSDYSAWVIYPKFQSEDSSYLTHLSTLANSLTKHDGIITSVIDPRTELLGVRVLTKKDLNLMKILSQENFNFSEGNCYRLYRYKLGIGEGVLDHPCGVCLPLENNVDLLNGVSFSKGCYIGQELTARFHFTMHIRKRLMPIILEPRDTYPEFPPESSIVNEKDEKLGRLRSNLGQFGLASLKHEDCLKAQNILLKGFNLKLEAIRPKWWPENVNNKS